MIRRQTQTLARAAFTLMEMLVVVAILVVLAGAAVPIYLNYLENAKRDRVKIDIKTLEQAVEAYYTRQGDYPPSLEALTQPAPDGTKATLEPDAILDPWRQPYQYSPANVNPNTGRPIITSTHPGLPNSGGR
jgi:general secretion pathway protein G